jgi:hypothetical protein
MSNRTNATISPDRAVGDPDPIAADTVPISSRAKRRQPGDGTGTTPAAAKVARLASAEEETKEQEGDDTPDTPLTTEKIMSIIKHLWCDDVGLVQWALREIANIGLRDAAPHENELEMRVLGVHSAVFQVLHKHDGCLAIQEEAMRALGNLSHLLETRKLLGDIGCVEVILASMEKYPDSESVQEYGCFLIAQLVDRTKYNAERVKKYGGIAVVIAAMKAHPNSKEVQEDGCIGLSNMSEWEEYRRLIVEAGGASAIAFAIEKSGDSQELRKEAYDAMRKLFKKPR